jgi:hypothetical protein
LDAYPLALFAYSMLELVEDDRPLKLLSSLPWEPERLTRVSWIDGMALIRRGPLHELGGYSTDPALAGWEDYELWCRCAESSRYAVHVPQVLGWHRPPAHRLSDVPPPEVIEHMRERFPRLFAGSGADVNARPAAASPLPA